MGTSKLQFRPTIPFASQTILTPVGKQFASPLNIQLSFPGNIQARCTQNTYGSVHDCFPPIESFTFNESHKYEDETNWYKIYEIDVFNSDGLGYYMQNYKLVLRLETNRANGKGAQIFSDVVFHDVHVRQTLIDELYIFVCHDNVVFTCILYRFFPLDKCCR